MIAQLHGVVASLGPTWLVLDVSGVGFRVLTTPATTLALRQGQSVTVHTSLVVREDSLTLFGFAEVEERDCFELVQSASGIGPKIALSVVSVLPPEALRVAVASGNVRALTAVPGIGPKGAQRLILELRDKVGALAVSASQRPGQLSWRDQVTSGLEGLGWSSKDAEAACDRIADLAEADPAPGIAELMRAALRSLAK